MPFLGLFLGLLYTHRPCTNDGGSTAEPEGGVEGGLLSPAPRYSPGRKALLLSAAQLYFVMTKVSCLYYLIAEKQNCVSQPSRHQMAHLCCTQESRAAQSCTAAPQLLLGVRVQSALWKNPQAATASATLTDARDGGNISTSEEWPCAEATAQTPLWNRGALPEEVLTCASYILG